MLPRKENANTIKKRCGQAANVRLKYTCGNAGRNQNKRFDEYADKPQVARCMRDRRPQLKQKTHAMKSCMRYAASCILHAGTQAATNTKRSMDSCVRYRPQVACRRVARMRAKPQSSYVTARAQGASPRSAVKPQHAGHAEQAAIERAASFTATCKSKLCGQAAISHLRF